MVVVNDATHLIGEASVAVAVLSTQPTSQGLLVFAKLATDRQTTGRHTSGRSSRSLA
jgi:hypothetical protein